MNRYRPDGQVYIKFGVVDLILLIKYGKIRFNTYLIVGVVYGFIAIKRVNNTKSNTNLTVQVVHSKKNAKNAIFAIFAQKRQQSFNKRRE